jgi:hypothetical protein
MLQQNILAVIYVNMIIATGDEFSLPDEQDERRASALWRLT